MKKGLCVPDVQIRSIQTRAQQDQLPEILPLYQTQAKGTHQDKKSHKRHTQRPPKTESLIPIRRKKQGNGSHLHKQIPHQIIKIFTICKERNPPR